MKVPEILNRLKKEKPEISASIPPGGAESIELDGDDLLAAAAFLRDDEELSFDFLDCLFAVDCVDHFEVLYIFHSYKVNHEVTLRVKLDRDSPAVESLSSLYPGANWHEREAFDLFGVTFLHHPDLRRILMPDDWEGYPMRRDYVHENLIRRPESD